MTMLSLCVLAAELAGEGKKLKTVVLKKRNLTKIDELSGCRSLERLDLSQNLIDDGQPLRACVKLSWLDMSGNKLVCMDFVQPLQHLTMLNLSYNQIDDLGPVAGLKGLKALVLSHNCLSRTEGLQNLTRLNTLVLSHNQLETIDIDMLSSLTKLQLAHNRISTFPCIKFNPELKRVHLNGNKIQEVPHDRIAGSRLDTVDLGNNEFEELGSLEALAELETIKQLNLMGNKVRSSANYTSQILEWFPRLNVLDSRKVDRALESKVPKKSTNDRKTKAPSEDEDGSPAKRKKSKVPVAAAAAAAAEDIAAKSSTKKRKRKKPKPEGGHKIQGSELFMGPQTEVVQDTDTKDNQESHTQSEVEGTESATAHREVTQAGGVNATSDKSSGVLFIKDVSKTEKEKEKLDATDIFSSFKSEVGSGLDSTW